MLLCNLDVNDLLPPAAVSPAPVGALCLAGCDSLHQLSESLGHAVDAKDPQTANHSREVAHFSVLLAGQLGLPETTVNVIHIAGHLHDIGKIGIPDAILQKQGKLTEEEWLWVKKHPDIGAKILSPVRQFSVAGGVSDLVRHHHERFDGCGYPCGLKGEEIPLGARIIAVADSLSALMQNRPYRQGAAFEEALAEIQRCSGSQFDPQVVKALVLSRTELMAIRISTL